MVCVRAGSSGRTWRDGQRLLECLKSDTECLRRLPPGVEAIATVGLQLEHEIDDAVDVEFLVTASGTAVALQLRPAGYRAPWRRSAAMWKEIRDEHDLQSGKIEALRTSLDDFQRGVELQVLRPPAFEEFRRTRRTIAGTLRDELASVFTRFVSAGAVSLRPAYWSAFHSSDSFPQSDPLKSVDGCIEHARTVWEYVLDDHLADYSAEVAIICGNWITPLSTVFALAHPREHLVVVATTAGYPEGIETLPHDQHIVNLDSLEATESTIVEQECAILEPGRPPLPLTPRERSRRAVSRRHDAILLAQAAPSHR